MSGRIDTRKWADFYGVTQRSVQKWVNALRPVEHPEAMAKEILTDPRSSPRARARATEILGGSVGNAPTPAPKSSSSSQNLPQADPQWQAFLEATGGTVESADTLIELKRQRAFAAEKLKTARAAGDVAGVKLYTDQFIRFDEAIHRNLIVAKKLGIDAGELMKRETVEQFLDALAFLLMRGADDAIDDLSAECVGKSFPEEIRPLIESYVLSDRILRPFRGVIEQKSPLGLPAWFVDKLISAAAANIEGARAALAEPATA